MGLGGTVAAIGQLPMWWNPADDWVRSMAKSAADGTTQLWMSLTDFVGQAGYVDFNAQWFLHSYVFIFTISIFVSALVLIGVMVRVGGGYAAPRTMFESMSGRMAVFVFGAAFGPLIGIKLQTANAALNQAIIDWGSTMVGTDLRQKIADTMAQDLGGVDNALGSIALSLLLGVVALVCMLSLFLLVTFLKLAAYLIMIFLPLILSLYVSHTHGALVRKMMGMLAAIFMGPPVALFLIVVVQMMLGSLITASDSPTTPAGRLSEILMILAAVVAPLVGTVAVLANVRHPRMGKAGGGAAAAAAGRSAIGVAGGASAAGASMAASGSNSRMSQVLSRTQARSPRLAGAMAGTRTAVVKVGHGAKSAAQGTGNAARRAANTTGRGAAKHQQMQQGKLNGALKWSSMAGQMSGDPSAVRRDNQARE